jgi:hypothetical protein
MQNLKKILWRSVIRWSSLKKICFYRIVIVLDAQFLHCDKKCYSLLLMIVNSLCFFSMTVKGFWIYSLVIGFTSRVFVRRKVDLGFTAFLLHACAWFVYAYVLTRTRELSFRWYYSYRQFSPRTCRRVVTFTATIYVCK